MLSPWIRQSVIGLLQNPCSVLQGSLLQILSFDDSKPIMLLSDSDVTIPGILSPLCKSKILEQNPLPSQPISSGLLIPKSFFYSKVPSISSSGEVVDIIVIRIEDVDMVNYSANGEYQETQKQLTDDLLVQHVLSMAPYGMLGLCTTQSNNQSSDENDTSLEGDNGMNEEDMSSPYLDESIDELVRLLDCTEEIQIPPVDDGTILPKMQAQSSSIQQVQNPLIQQSTVTNPVQTNEVTEHLDRLCTQPESSCFEQPLIEQKSKYFIPASPPDSTDGVIQMTQPSDISLRERVSQHVRSQKRDALARELESLGISCFSWKREWNSRWKELLFVF